jgi:NAD(P)-dependent dehydrogenase (short-subunit alcohol dehydrogenase family)
MENRLQGSTALVTGASRGYGAGIAESLAREGARVWIAARSAADLGAVARRIGAQAVTADVTRGEDWDRLFAAIGAGGGRLDILVNNAGGTARVAPLQDWSDEEVGRELNLNLTGAILGCRRAAALMRGQKGGTIVNVASVCAVEAWPQWGVYSAAKAGLLQLTKCLYAELRPHGARATCLIPSWGATNFSRAAGLPEFDPQTAGKCIQPLELGRVVADICALPAHLSIQELILWPLVQEVAPL